MTAQISTVKFLRHCAETSGGLKTSRGQAFHRAAGHVVRLDEELQRVRGRALCMSAESLEYRTQVAQNIFAQVRQDARDQGLPEPPTWESLPPEQHARFLKYAEAALGAPAYERPVLASDEEEAKTGATDEMDASAQG